MSPRRRTSSSATWTRATPWPPCALIRCRPTASCCWTAVAVAVGQVVSVADIAAGKLTFQPGPNENGLPYATFTFSVQDAAGAFDPTPNTFAINVTPLDDTPGAADDRAVTPEDQPVLIDVLKNDTDIDGDPLTITEINGQPVTTGVPVTLKDADGATIGSVTLTPEGKLNFIPALNYNGPVDFTYTVTDGRTPVQANVHVDVLPQNDQPDAVDDKATGGRRHADHHPCSQQRQRSGQGPADRHRDQRPAGDTRNAGGCARRQW